MSTDIDVLLTCDSDSFGEHLEKFLEKADKVFLFPELQAGSKREELWSTLCKIAQTTENNTVLKNCFTAIRILSREKQGLNNLITEDSLELFKKHIGFCDKNFKFNEKTIPVCLEVQKSLCNMCYNSKMVADKCCKCGILDGILERIRRYKEQSMPEDVEFFDMKLLFLLTTLCPELRYKLKDLLPILVDIAEANLLEAAEHHASKNEPPIFLSNKQADYVCELLKAIFNLSLHTNTENPETMALMINLTALLRNYLLITTNSLENTWTLRNHVINLLTNIPDECYKYLLLPVQDTNKIPKNLQFEGQNMMAIYEIVMFLKAKFNEDPNIASQHEILSPVMTVLLKGAASNRAIRKFLRIQILPPLKDVHSRPEQGTTLRNHLCRLLTTPITQLRDLVAELLFLLCKRNVARMIKYTGYGNAAGLFAQRGLLAGGRYKGEDEFSSDSGDSETEEYAEHKHGINPVLGCYEEPHQNPMASMTDEQKEYEAMKLVELMDSMLKTGTIKPCMVGEDGKPHPIEHVLQLQEGMKLKKQNSDSDSD